MSKNSIEVLMAEKRTFPPSREFSERAHIKSYDEYDKIYKRSVEDPEGFWGEMAEEPAFLVQEVGQGARIQL